MRIAYIIEEGRYGGPQASISAIASTLKNYDVTPLVVCPINDSDLFCEKLDSLDIKYIKAPLRKLARSKWQLLKYLIFFSFEVAWLYALFRKYRYDLVHCSGGAWQYKGVIAGRLAGIKTVWHLNDTYMPRILQMGFKFIAKYCADGLIVEGQRVKQYYANQALETIPTFEVQAPVDTTHFDEARAEPDERLEQIDGIRIVTVGALNPAKGCEYFIAMAKLLTQRFGNLDFFLVGPHYQTQQKYITNLKTVSNGMQNLHFYGPSISVREVLKAADIYVCSSITEASPISVWEAMSMSKAIVATDVGDIARFLRDGVSGFVVPPANPQALADKVAELIENPQLGKQFGAAARQQAVQNLDVNITVQKHYDCYRTLLGQ